MRPNFSRSSRNSYRVVPSMFTRNTFLNFLLLTISSNDVLSLFNFLFYDSGKRGYLDNSILSWTVSRMFWYETIIFVSFSKTTFLSCTSLNYEHGNFQKTESISAMELTRLVQVTLMTPVLTLLGWKFLIIYRIYNFWSLHSHSKTSIWFLPDTNFVAETSRAIMVCWSGGLI